MSKYFLALTNSPLTIEVKTVCRICYMGKPSTQVAKSLIFKQLVRNYSE